MPGNNCSYCSRSQTAAFIRSSKPKDSKYLEKVKLRTQFPQQKLILLVWEFSRTPRILCVCYQCSWLCRYRYLEQTPAAKVPKLLVIRTADPQPFVMPSVCDVSEAREEEDEGKDRGYWNDPHGWGADGEYRLKNVLFVNMRDKVLLYLKPHPLDDRMLPDWVVFLQSSQVSTLQLGPKLSAVLLKYEKHIGTEDLLGRGSPQAKTWSKI